MTNKNSSSSRTGIPNPVDIYVGERLKERRKSLGLTQTDLANMLLLSFQQILKYEKGTNRISASRLFDISNVLEVNISYFFNKMPASVLKKSPRLISNSKDKENG